MMNDLRGMSPAAPYGGVPGANNGAVPPQFPGHHGLVPAPSNARVSVQMVKRAGEGSFGMTLDQDVDATAADCPRVSYVFPNSAASRAGVRSGWTIEFINGVSCRGRRVRDVAPIFRDLQQVILFVDIRTESTEPATLPPLIGGINHTSPSAFAPRAPTPPPVMWPSQPSTLAPPPPQHPSLRYPVPASGAATAVDQNALLAMMRAGVSPMVPSSAAMAMPQAMPLASHAPLQTPVPTWQPLPVSAPIAQPRTSALPTTMSHPTPLSSNGVSPFQPVVSASASVGPATAASSAAPPRAAPASTPMAVAAVRATPVPSTSAPASSAPPAAVSIATTATTAASSPSPVQRGPTAATASASAATPAAPTTAQTTPTTSRAAGKKRSRAQSESKAAATVTPSPSTETAAAAPAPAGRKRGRQQKRRQSAPPTVSDMWDSDDAVFFYGSDLDPDVEEVSPPRAGSGSRRTSTRQAESGGRARRSTTVSRLITMGFTQELAELSVQHCGHDPDKCMLWIVSHLEEKQFMNDLNTASIESENQRRLDAQQQKEEETETLRQATAFTSLFQTSYILSDIANAPRLKAMLASTIGEIAADTLMRTLVTKLLTVESKAIRWYKAACKCYMLELAARLETAFASHDAITCCSTLMATQPASEACSFVRALHEEEQALTKALFFMPENQGGVPLAFLRADESMQFSLDDDGFEVVDQPPPPASPSLD